MLMALIQWEGKVTKLSDDPTHTVGSSALASRWAVISLSPAELLLVTLIQAMIPS